MNHLKTGAFVAMGLLVGLMLGQVRWIGADQHGDAGSNSPVQLVSYSAGLTGLYVEDERRIYLYDSNLSNCVAIRELGVPGEPMKKIELPSAASSATSP